MNQENEKDSIIINWQQFVDFDEKAKIGFGMSLFEALQLELARQAFEITMKYHPKSLEAIDHYTDILEQLNKDQEILTLLEGILVESNESILREYDMSYKLFFKYAQQKNGESIPCNNMIEAIQYYKLGIGLLDLVIKKSEGAPLKQLQRDISDAYAAVAEIYQSDLLQQKESEQACVQNIELAFQYDPQNLDAFFQLANFHLNKEDEEKAKQDLRVIYERLMEVANQDDNYEEDFKLQVSKLLVEVEEFNQAGTLLQKIIDNNDKNPEIVYLFAYCKWKLGFYSESLKIAHGIINMPEAKADQEIFTATQELIAELGRSDMSTDKQQQEDEDWMDLE